MHTVLAVNSPQTNAVTRSVFSKSWGGNNYIARRFLFFKIYFLSKRTYLDVHKATGDR